MRKFFRKYIFLSIFSISCTAPEKKDSAKTRQPDWSPEGTWYFTDMGTGNTLRKQPIFVLKGDGTFLDSSAAICQLEKIASGEITATFYSDSPLNDYKRQVKNLNCPDYTDTWTTYGLTILHADNTPTALGIKMHFAPTEGWQIKNYPYRYREYHLFIKFSNISKEIPHPIPEETRFPVIKGLVR